MLTKHPAILLISTLLTMLVLWKLMFSSYENSPELPPALAAVECPANAQNEKNRALMHYGNRDLYFVCLHDLMLKRKLFLLCDQSMDPPECGKEAQISMGFSRGKDDTIYRGMYPNQFQKGFDEKATLKRKSYFTVYIARQSYGDREDPEQNDYFKLRKPANVPEGFDIHGDIWCQRKATVLHYGMCLINVSHGDVHMKTSVQVSDDEGNTISNKRYQENIVFWLKHMDNIITVPEED